LTRQHKSVSAVFREMWRFATEQCGRKTSAWIHLSSSRQKAKPFTGFYGESANLEMQTFEGLFVLCLKPYSERSKHAA